MTPVEKWLAALRSRRYKQGNGVLHNRREKTYCCLGVACKLYQQEKRDLVTRNGRDGELAFVLYDGEASVLPEKVKDWLGLRTASGDYTAPFWGIRALTDDNDAALRFEDIADLIASRPEGLFIA